MTACWLLLGFLATAAQTGNLHIAERVTLFNSLSFETIKSSFVFAEKTNVCGFFDSSPFGFCSESFTAFWVSGQIACEGFSK